MSTITLEEIKTTQTKLAEMIAAFESNLPCTFDMPKQSIVLAPGEHYAGLIIGEDGNACYHLILLSGDAKNINWKKAQKWAKEAGGELPTQREQSLLYANLKEQFEESWYWSCEQHASYSGYAWGQNFYYGGQNRDFKSSEGRARAVRRLPI